MVPRFDLGRVRHVRVLSGLVLDMVEEQVAPHRALAGLLVRLSLRPRADLARRSWVRRAVRTRPGFGLVGPSDDATVERRKRRPSFVSHRVHPQEGVVEHGAPQRGQRGDDQAVGQAVPRHLQGGETSRPTTTATTTAAAAAAAAATKSRRSCFFLQPVLGLRGVRPARGRGCGRLVASVALLSDMSGRRAAPFVKKPGPLPLPDRRTTPRTSVI